MSADPMSSMADMECNNFFDHIDDLLDFPEDNSMTNDGTTFSRVWNVSPHSLLNPDLDLKDFGTGCSPDLAAELSIPYEDIVQMEWLSMFMEDSFGAGNAMTLDRRDFPVSDDGVVSTAVPHTQFHSSSPVSVLESSSSTSSCSEGGRILTPCIDNDRLRGGCGRARTRSLRRAGRERLRERAADIPIPFPSDSGAAQIGRTGRSTIRLERPTSLPRCRCSKRPRPPTFKPGSAMQLISPAQSFIDTRGTYGEELNELLSLKKASAATGLKKVKKSVKPFCPAEMSQNEDSVEPAASDSQAAVRKCLHCEITKTPQWRAGPLGPKTLCNACGVRYKSGRLFPEYRPATSPTFVPSLHSNSHKKVLEMRTTTAPNSPPTSLSEDLTRSDETQPEFIPNKNALLD